jgi:hypothetical protein
VLQKSPFSYFIHIELDIIPGKHEATTLKGVKLGCENKKENIIKNIDEIRNVKYKPKLLSKEYLLSHDPEFPVEKFLPESITPTELKEETESKEKTELKEETELKEKKTKGGNLNQIANLFHNISFLNDYLQ